MSLGSTGGTGPVEPLRGRFRQTVVRSEQPFALRALIAVALLAAAVVIAGFIYTVGTGLLVLFVCILLALVFDAIASFIARLTGLSRQVALALSVLLLVGALIASATTGGIGLFEQMPTLSKQLEASINQVNVSLSHIGWVRSVAGSSKPATSAITMGSHAMGDASNLFTLTIGALTNVFVVLVVSVYLSWSPQLYMDAAVALAPRRYRARLVEVIHASAQGLRRWLLGQMAAMAMVFVFITSGLLILGVNMALALGVIAGTLTFVPYLGGILASVPAILIAFLVSPLQAGYVALLFLASYMVEGYFLTPMIQQRAISVAPAFLLIAQVLAGRFSGIAAVFIAAPLLVVMTIWVQMLYVEDVLGDHPHILGAEDDDDEDAADDDADVDAIDERNSERIGEQDDDRPVSHSDSAGSAARVQVPSGSV